MSSDSLKSRVIVITGGARGIGLAIATACKALGAKVAIGDVETELAQHQAMRCGFALGEYLDVRDRDVFSRFLATVRDELGPIDVLVNNAGIMPTGPFTEETDALSDTQIDINLRGVILGCKLVLPAMLDRNAGHVVNVASMAGVLPVPGLAVYCATKHAVVGLTQTLREEYRDTGIAFSTIMPAKVTTDLAAGTEQAARGVPTSSPQVVADAVVKAIIERQTDVTVPSYLKFTPSLLNLTPVGLQQGFRKLVGDRRILEKLDAPARHDYNNRIATLADKLKGSSL